MTNRYDLIKIQEKLQKKLTPDRYQHTLGVMYTCAALAMCHGCNLERAMVAGLLHDCAKCIPNDKKISICEKNNIAITEAERKNPSLLHAKAGVFLAKSKYDIEDEDILDAIRYHTTGNVDMTLLQKITYLADYIEPWRHKATNLPAIREAAFQDLDKALYMVLHDTLQYLETIHAEVDSTTQEAYEFYRPLQDEKQD